MHFFKPECADWESIFHLSPVILDMSSTFMNTFTANLKSFVRLAFKNISRNLKPQTKKSLSFFRKLSWCGWDWGRLVCQTGFFLSSTSTLEGATTLSIMTFSLTALSIIAFSMKINKTRHSYAQHNGRLLFCRLLFMPYVLYAKCSKIDLYGECYYAECL